MRTLSRWIAAAVMALPLAAQADILQFNANLNASNEVQGSTASGTGVATLFYDTRNTLSTADDTFDFSMSVFGLPSPATAFHIHGAATTAENGPVRIALDANPFLSLVSGNNLLVGGSGIAAPGIPATGTGPFAGVANAGHPAMSFLAMLQSGLAYVNVHTSGFPGGAIRGQLLQVAAVPEPETYAMLLAGIGLVVGTARRRRKPA
ncbi:MAG: CHRD domain-containing protein [Rhodospirillaceae bacterium]|nr:CHRD domain-containing protein [Rhodospirillaceae bacterium]